MIYVEGNNHFFTYKPETFYKRVRAPYCNSSRSASCCQSGSTAPCRAVNSLFAAVPPAAAKIATEMNRLLISSAKSTKPCPNGPGNCTRPNDPGNGTRPNGLANCTRPNGSGNCTRVSGAHCGGVGARRHRVSSDSGCDQSQTTPFDSNNRLTENCLGRGPLHKQIWLFML